MMDLPEEISIIIEANGLAMRPRMAPWAFALLVPTLQEMQAGLIAWYFSGPADSQRFVFWGLRANRKAANSCEPKPRIEFLPGK